MFAYYYRGRTHRELEMYSEALDDFSRAMFIDNTVVENYLERFEIYSNQENYLLAFININGACKIDSASIRSLKYAAKLNQIGIYCMKVNNKSKALLAFQLSTLADPRWIEPFLNRGLIYRQLKKYDIALTEYNNAVELDSTVINTYYQRAVTYLDSGLIKEAEKDLMKVLHLDEKNEKAVFKLAKLYYDEKKDERALVYFQKVIELDKDNVWSYYWLGFLFDRNKQYNTAIKHYNRFLSLVSEDYFKHKLSVRKRISTIKSIK